MKPKILLISPGGCACTSFITFLKNNGVSINNENDKDRLKHTLPWNPLIKKYKATHIIYLYGDLDKTVRSLFRRKFHRPQYYKLHNIFNHKDIPIPFNNFKQYIRIVENSKTEPLGILNHYNDWKAVPNVFFIHYESIPTSSELDTFLQLPLGTCRKFIIKDRTSEQNENESSEYLNLMKHFTEKIKP